ncbi:MAG TPA: 1,2-phenylacetyl-CoA epoxidase subunit PaaD [Saprospiraceae bacterium]|nr:1,2-phenylacetyl-CoA epoxidase subunit PaaD [Saprospiraceae bacterium]
MVTLTHISRRQIADILSEVSDPEIPGISIVDLGMVVDIFPDDEHWHVLLATTYSGCPAIDVIPTIVRTKFEDEGIENVVVSMGISPPWSTDWISVEGKEKLLAYGIAPPNGSPSLNDEGKPKQCPQCGSVHTSLVSLYGSTPCKAAYRCETCLEPFEYFKCF